MKILIIDDSYSSVEHIIECFDIMHYNTIWSKDGNILEDNIQRVNDFDVIILDLFLRDLRFINKLNSIPLMYSGIHIIKRIRESSEIPIIIMSSANYSSVKEYLNKYKNIIYLSKNSVTLVELIDKIKAIISKDYDTK